MIDWEFNLVIFPDRVLQSNESDHRFEKLIQVDIVFFYLFFPALIIQIFFEKNRLGDFFLFSFLSGYPDLMSEPRVWRDNTGWLNLNYWGYKFFMQTRIDSGYFLGHFFLPNFNLSYLMGLELNYIICPVLEKYFFHRLLWSLFFFKKKFVSLSIFYYHLIKKKQTYSM